MSAETNAAQAVNAAIAGNAPLAARAAERANNAASAAQERANKAPTATNLATAAGATEAAEVAKKAAAAVAPNTKSSPKVGKAIQLLGAIGVESAAGFGTGFMLGKGNKGGVAGTIIALSAVFAFEFYLRYNKSTSSWALLAGGFLLLVAAGIVPYLAMTSPKVKGKGKTGAAAAPTMAGAWALAALLYGVVCAMMSKDAVAVADALQGVILSLLYAGVTVAGGYSAAAQPANLPYALATWGALVLFDMAGLARAPPAAGVPAAANA